MLTQTVVTHLYLTSYMHYRRSQTKTTFGYDVAHKYLVLAPCNPLFCLCLNIDMLTQTVDTSPTGKIKSALQFTFSPFKSSSTSGNEGKARGGEETKYMAYTANGQKWEGRGSACHARRRGRGSGVPSSCCLVHVVLRKPTVLNNLKRKTDCVLCSI